jgi:hypothetical protein
VENRHPKPGRKQISRHSFFFRKTKPETMGAIRHGLCRRSWQSSACSSAMILLATSWATPGALG